MIIEDLSYILDQQYQLNAQQLAKINTVWIALSGGIDSIVLLHSLKRSALAEAVTLKAIHVNHHLQSAAEQAQCHCEQVCKSLDIPLQIEHVKILPSSGNSIEAQARVKRYQALAKYITESACLVTAHHQQDQAETLLLQLLRGAGPKGLAAMPALSTFSTGLLWRPLLTVPQKALCAYAEQHKLRWIDDTSNADMRFDRNYLRHQVWPLLTARWPSATQTLARSAQWCAEYEILLSNLLSIENIRGSVPNTLSIQALKQLSALEQRYILRQWLIECGFVLPNAKKLQSIMDTVLNCRVDANPLVVYGGCHIRRYRDDLYALRTLEYPPPDYCVQWQWQQPLKLPADLGELSMQRLQQQGFSFENCAHELTVTFRQQGDKLKKRMQSLAIPPWQRARTVLIYQDDHLLWLVKPESP
ncbi:MAG: tRNA lysidine(34) synthetase TilS [Gammaproteobacteria bacterium]